MIEGIDSEPVFIHFVMERDDISGKKDTFREKFWGWGARRDGVVVCMGACGRGCRLGAVRAIRERRFAGGIDNAKRDAVLLVSEHGFFPVLYFGQLSPVHQTFDIYDGLACGGVVYFNKGDGDETGSTKTAYGLCDEPLAIGLSDDCDSITALCFQFILALCLKVMLYDGIKDL